MREEIKSLLDRLRLRGMAACLDDLLNDAEKHGKSTDDVLVELLETEYRDQQERRLSSRIKQAKLPWDWTIDTFPFKQQPGINKTQIMGLAKLTFIERNENVIFIGKPGAGKSGIAMGAASVSIVEWLSRSLLQRPRHAQ